MSTLPHSKHGTLSKPIAVEPAMTNGAQLAPAVIPASARLRWAVSSLALSCAGHSIPSGVPEVSIELSITSSIQLCMVSGTARTAIHIPTLDGARATWRHVEGLAHLSVTSSSGTVLEAVFDPAASPPRALYTRTSLLKSLGIRSGRYEFSEGSADFR